MTNSSTSVSGATIPIIDASGNEWTIVGGVVYENGHAAGVSANVVLLLFYKNEIFQQNQAGNWWVWNGTTWSTAVDPRPVANTSNTVTVNANVTVNTSNTVANTTPAANVVLDAANNKWTLVGGVVYENGTATVSSNVVTLIASNGVIYQENKSNNWWKWVNSGWVATTDPRIIVVANTSNTVANTSNTTPPVVVTPITNTAGLTVSGKSLMLNGKPTVLVGFNLSGMETGMPSRWAGIAGLPSSFYSEYAAKYSKPGLAINTVRIPWNSDSLLGVNSAQYQNDLKAIAAAITEAGMICNFDLHWDAPNTASGATQAPVGQGALPGVDRSIPAWTWMAQTFKNNPMVSFELFNEPFASNVYGNWVDNNGPGKDAFLMRDGGTIQPFQCQNNGNNNAMESLNGGAAVKVAGYQTLLNAIRAAGANNVCFTAPIGWAGEIETYLGSMPTDPVGQLGCSWHVYGYTKGNSYPLAVAAKMPLVITETYGFNGTFTGKGNAYTTATGENIGVIWWGPNNWGAEDSTALIGSLLGSPPWMNSQAP